jgi:hypothetical protein
MSLRLVYPRTSSPRLLILWTTQRGRAGPDVGRTATIVSRLGPPDYSEALQNERVIALLRGKRVTAP